MLRCMSVEALVLAAGRGTRMGGNLPKAFVELAGAPLIEHAVLALAAAPSVRRIVPVIPREDFERFASLDLARRGALGGRLAAPVAGGAERQDSMRCGLAALGGDVELVAVHDAARPLVRADAVERVIAAARSHGAAILATPVTDTIKRVRGGAVVETPLRSECWAAQTPQVFAPDALREGVEKAVANGRVASDDAQLVEWIGVRVSVVEGSPDNLKITHPADLIVAERQLAARAARGTGGPP